MNSISTRPGFSPSLREFFDGNEPDSSLLQSEIVSGFPPESSVRAISDSRWSGQWVTISRDALRAAGGVPFQLVRPVRWMALERYLPWWSRPVFGVGSSTGTGEFFLILWEREDGGYGVALPLVDGDIRGVLLGGENGWSVRVPPNDPPGESATVLFVACGDDPLELVSWAVGKIAERLATFQLRTQKAVPAWVDHLGWCTWDAFYLEVTAEKVLEGLASFQRGGFSPKVVILDGGWQDERDEQLWSFGAHPERFPHGFQPLATRARTEFGVERFAVWHTLQGFWNGVHPEGELAGLYRLVSTEGVAYNMPDTGIKQRSMVHPDDIGRFFDDYHHALRAQGANMVKVDNQGALDHFCTPDVPPTAVMHAYQSALQDSVQANFGGQCLHCMSHSTDAAYALQAPAVWRSSQDFFPARPEVQGLHIFDNAFNSIWVGTFALPDWDMFQSAHPAAGFHAAARAISGGPVYVSDKPGQHDFALLSKLMVCGGRILRSKQPALPARDELFEDGRSRPRVTKIVNFNEVEGLARPIGVLGLFNCFHGDAGSQAVAGEYGPADVRLSASQFALYHHGNGMVMVTEASRRFPIRLESLGFEIVTVSPMENGVAIFGLLDKFNGSRALDHARWISGDQLELHLADGGRFGWGGERGVAEAIGGGTPCEVLSRDGLNWVQLPEGAPIGLRLNFKPTL